MARALLSSFAVATLFAAALSPLACSGSSDGSVDESAEQGLKVGDCIEEVVKPGAGASCAEKGLLLDKDLSSSTGEVKHRCCKPSPTPIPGPVPGRCFGDSLGGPTSCKSVDTWKLYATAICEKQGAKLTFQDFAEPCGGTPVPPPVPVASDGKTPQPVPPTPVGSFRYTKFMCCTDQGCTPVPEPVPPTQKPGDPQTGTSGGGTASGSGGGTVPPPGPICPPPPPPPPKCFGGGIAVASGPNGQAACLSADEIKKDAVAMCQSQGAELTSLKLGAPCANGGYSGGSWECCYGTTPPPPPPPPPPPCFGGIVGDGKTCQSDVDLKKLASAKCEANGAQLTNLSYGAVCGIVAGSHFEAKFECCAGPTPVSAPQPAPSK
jgi:hypothetical protein